jgi:hypothetical protein
MLPVPNSPDGLATLPHLVIRIRCRNTKTNAQGVGTGFAYSFDIDGHCPMLVSNKHVLTPDTDFILDFAAADSAKQRVLGPPVSITVPANKLPILNHPDPGTDLAMIPLAPCFDQGSRIGRPLSVLSLDKSSIPGPTIQNSLHAATPALMVGFPTGLMDEANNLPVVRRGSLATPYIADYQGRSAFVVDIASFGGSSGSPVFSIFEGVAPQPDGRFALVPEPVIHFIGVLYAGPVMNAKGEIVAAPAPTSSVEARTRLMIHLGYCIKAHEVESMRGLVERLR